MEFSKAYSYNPSVCSENRKEDAKGIQCPQLHNGPAGHRGEIKPRQLGLTIRIDGKIGRDQHVYIRCVYRKDKVQAI
jgi:hypothetical protein